MNPLPSNCYAVIPAAGLSRRMGSAKLLLPWPIPGNPDATVIDSVLDAWTSSKVLEVVVVVRASDGPLTEACQRWPVNIVHPDQSTADMKATVAVGLQFLQTRFRPTVADRCFVAPADLPTLRSEIVNRLVDTPADCETIVVPSFGGRQGHPALLPWPITAEIFKLDKDEGINRIVQQHPKLAVSFEASLAVDDVDTPSEYRAAINARDTKS